jgi:hypothetical protein
MCLLRSCKVTFSLRLSALSSPARVAPRNCRQASPDIRNGPKRLFCIHPHLKPQDCSKTYIFCPAKAAIPTSMSSANDTLGRFDDYLRVALAAAKLAGTHCSPLVTPLGTFISLWCSIRRNNQTIYILPCKQGSSWCILLTSDSFYAEQARRSKTPST